VRKPADLAQHRLLHIETRDDWRLWFAAQGIEIDWRRGPLLVDTAIGVQAAVAGRASSSSAARLPPTSSPAAAWLRLCRKGCLQAPPTTWSTRRSA